MTRTKAYRGRGSRLTSKTCEVGARVRITASTGLMAGQTGSIVSGETTDKPTVRFKSGQELQIPKRKLQLVQKASEAPPPPAARPKMFNPQDARLVLTKPDGTKEVIKPIDIGALSEDYKAEVKKKKPTIRRDDADWNF